MTRKCEIPKEKEILLSIWYISEGMNRANQGLIDFPFCNFLHYFYVKYFLRYVKYAKCSHSCERKNNTITFCSRIYIFLKILLIHWSSISCFAFTLASTLQMSFEECRHLNSHIDANDDPTYGNSKKSYPIH